MVAAVRSTPRPASDLRCPWCRERCGGAAAWGECPCDRTPLHHACVAEFRGCCGCGRALTVASLVAPSGPRSVRLVPSRRGPPHDDPSSDGATSVHLPTACPRAATCWAGVAAACVPGNEAPASRLSAPWIGPHYDQSRMVVLLENMNAYGGSTWEPRHRHEPES